MALCKPPDCIREVREHGATQSAIQVDDGCGRDPDTRVRARAVTRRPSSESMSMSVLCAEHREEHTGNTTTPAGVRDLRSCSYLGLPLCGMLEGVS